MKALVLTALIAAVAFAQPTVTVSPTAGPPTDKVAVSGTGFGADEAVDLYFDTADMALAPTGPGGSFTGIGLVIPAYWENILRTDLHPEEQLQDYFALCLACHHATVATFEIGRAHV